MATINDLQSARTTSGARYAAAVTELLAAYTELAGLDGAINNALGRNAGSHLFGEGQGSGGPAVATFRGDFDFVPAELRHPQFAPNALGSFITAVRAEINSRLASLS